MSAHESNSVVWYNWVAYLILCFGKDCPLDNVNQKLSREHVKPSRLLSTRFVGCPAGGVVFSRLASL